MQFFWLSTFIVLWSTLKISRSQDSCSVHTVAVKADSYMKRMAFRRLIVVSLDDCAAKCVMSSACKSFNFDPGTRICQLNSNSSNNVDVLPKFGFLFSDIHHWPERISGPCSAKRCPAGHECVLDKDGKTACKQEFLGCGAPPFFTATQVSYEGDFLEAEAVYMCANHYQSCGPNPAWTFTCETSGTWKGVSQRCERYRWLDQHVKNFTQPITCGPTDRFKITWTGKPLAATHFETFFMVSSDYPFYVDIRFHHIGCNKFTVANSRRGVVGWGAQKFLQIFPFAVNRTFVMEMTLLHGAYLVKVDGRYLIGLSKSPIRAKPETFVIKEDVEVSRVEISVG